MGNRPMGYGPKTGVTKKAGPKNTVYRVNYMGPGWGDIDYLGAKGSRGRKQK